MNEIPLQMRATIAIALAVAACGEPHRSADSATDADTPDTLVLDTGPDTDRPDSASDATSDAATTNPNADTIARAGVVLGSCLGDDGANRVIESLWHPERGATWSRFASGLECLATAELGCAALPTCLGIETEISFCTPSSTCEGDVWDFCGDGHIIWDCARIGATCDPIGGCVTGPVETCDRTTFVRDCSADGAGRYCTGNGAVREGPKCGDLGLTCSAGECAGTGPACAGDSGPDGVVEYTGLSCDGAEMTACVERREHTLDCAALQSGFSCRERDYAGVPRVFCGLADECVPGDVRGSTCAGATTMTVCNAGRIDMIDCVELGFTGCEERSGEAYCVPFLP